MPCSLTDNGMQFRAEILFGIVLLSFLTASVALAQEKSFVWVSETKQLALPGITSVATLFDQDNAVLYRSGALAFIRATFGCKSGNPPQLVPCVSDSTPTFLGSKDYVVIHVVRWKDPDPHSGAQSVDKQNWYLFNQGNGDWDDDAYSKNNRIFGSKNVYLLYLHFNAKSRYLARYTLTAKKKTPAYLLHFAGLLQLFGVNTAGGARLGETIPAAVPNAAWGVQDLDAYYVPADLSFEPTMLPPLNSEPAATAPPPGAPTSTPPASPPSIPSTQGTSPSSGVSDTLPATASGPSGGQGNTPPAPAAGTNASSSSSMPSLTTEVKLDSHTFDNEGLYHVDFTVAVPIRKIGEISYVSSSNTLVPAKVDKQTTFGVVDYYFKPIDVKGSGCSLYPHALAGVAINSHPLKRVLIGGGYGPLLAHFYMGLVLDTQSLPPGGACGKLPSAAQLASGTLHNRTCPGFSLGLNVSVASVLDSLKSKSSSSSGSKAK